MKQKIWIATYVDHGESCDGKARVLGIYKSNEEAKTAVKNDIEKWADDRAGEDIEVDFDNMNTYYYYDFDTGCEWNIEEFELDVNN